MTDTNATTPASGRETNSAGTGAATVRGKPARPARRSPPRSQGSVSMICIPGQRRTENGRDGAIIPVRGDAAVARVVITRDPGKPIYICWNDVEGANLSVAIEAGEKE